MKKVIRLTESDLTRIVKRVIMEQTKYTSEEMINFLKNNKWRNINTGGKYKIYLEKEDKTSYPIPYKYVLTSQSDNNFNLAVYSLPNMKFIGNTTIKSPTELTDQFILLLNKERDGIIIRNLK